PVTRENARPDFHELVRRAVQETTGEVLRDARGSLARDVYFSTSCGGQTANIQTLWGTPAREPYQRGLSDEYCAAMPHSRWTDAIPSSQLAKALADDERTNVGARVEQLSVVKRDATGRVEQIAITGERGRKVVRGWDFKIVVGRTLGWSVLKSSRFEVRRAGEAFVFRGSGFGHGLGLCQSGAHVMAARGSSYRQILAYYFPGTNVGGASVADLTRPQQADHAAIQSPKPLENAAAANEARRVASFAHAKAAHFAHANVAASTASPPRLSLSSENFRVSYPATVASNGRRDLESALSALEAARRDVRARLASASVSFPALGVLEVFVHETTGDFTGATGKPAWVAATTRGRRIELQPLSTLRRRNVLAPTLRHEYAHAVIEALSRGRAPLWLAEGLAAHVAGEGAMLARHESKQKFSAEELEKRLAAPASAAEMRSLYAAAFREVNALIRAEGEAGVWRRVARS
ncbi:MAG TPA: SpoIID/LytB domain-containing protein, partial [Pyrinomonadaceae bacterium]|nr:SpoIID/LytB domain-containing protein [Pyrinomonadaceae bacterium]